MLELSLRRALGRAVGRLPGLEWVTVAGAAAALHFRDPEACDRLALTARRRRVLIYTDGALALFLPALTCRPQEVEVRVDDVLGRC